jgi:metallo-beta-lactamase family protein
MRIGFYGATGTVTGSKHVITLHDGRKILLDCGMFQGLGSDTRRLNANFGFDASTISAVILSHAHIDHSGLLPKLVKEGFTGKIYSTSATKSLTAILLDDSAAIQAYAKSDTNNSNGKGYDTEDSNEPLYTAADVTQTMDQFECVGFDETIHLYKDVTFSFTHAGHLIGSAAVHLSIREEGKTKRVTFSGDIGRYHSLLMKAPEPFEQADIIIMESTYGDTHRGLVSSSLEDLHSWIQKTCIEKGGKLIIPAFSVGRTQELLYLLNQMELENRLPALNYFVDSPLSMQATEVIKQYPAEFGNHLQRVLETDDDPFSFKGLRYIETVEESKQLEAFAEPCVIISTSGTADAGRVRHHIFNSVDQEKHTILLVGYCEAKSLGGQLLKGIESVDIMGHSLPVHAETGKIESLSAHGDCDDMCRWLACQDAGKVKAVFLVHGERAVQERFAAKLSVKGFTKIYLPEQGENVEV